MERDKLIERNFEDRYNVRKWAGYLYYDTPDGEDLHLKVGFASKVGLCLGIHFGVLEAYSSRPYAKNYKDRFLRFGKKAVPIFIASNMYAFVTYVSTRLRKKDDYVNHFFGGVAAGSVLGAGANCAKKGLALSLLIGCIGVAQKAYKQHFGTFKLAHAPMHFTPASLRRFDTSIFSDDIRGNWTREPSK